MGAPYFAQDTARQESVMRLQEPPASLLNQRIPAISTTPRSFLAVIVSLACVLSLGIELPASAANPASAKDKKPKNDPALKGLPITELSPDEAILHALNRLAYGPRPGDIERVRQMGLAKWIEQQLNPNSIDDRALDARLADYPTLRMSTAKLIDEYPQPKQAEKQAEKRAQAQAQQEQRRSDTAAETVARDMHAAQGQTKGGGETEAPQQKASTAKQEMSDAPRPLKQEQPEGNPATKGVGKRDVLGGADPNNVPRAIADDSKRPQRVVAELGMAKVRRAIYSGRQLQQVMDDFWFNHFNVFAGKGEDRYYITSYERDVIQPHAFGKFKDLVTATAKSPAMLFYLDNFLSADPRAAQRQAAERAARQQWRRGRFGWPAPPRPVGNPQAKKNERGLNENYGRELMELHTLGVDGGYTQKDVTEVARCFTGWTIERPRQGGDFKFDPRLHDTGQKLVLGHVIKPGGGERDGEEVLNILARHPSTARFIATKLVRRFVSDAPPAALVDRAATRFHETGGELREVMRTILTSPEFVSDDARRAKVKTPFEFLASALRATGAGVEDATPLVRAMQQFGMPLYMCQPPTGYKDTADAWVNTGALVSRMNFALQLAGQKLNGTTVESAESRVDSRGLIASMLGGDASETTRATIEKAPSAPQMIALTLGSPEFQRK